MWADQSEEVQAKHLRPTKEQMEYVRIHAEYEYVKKRALVNYLTNEKLNLEQHFHNRALNLLKSVQNYENQNLRNRLREIALGSL
jgi:hypothetical protein